MKQLGVILEKLTDHYKNYDISDKKIISDYTTESRDLNGYHWNKHHNPTNKLNAFFETQSSLMDKTINKNKLDKPKSVYSGVMYDPRRAKNALGIVHHPGYLSTSLNKSTAQDFALENSEDDENQHILKIKVPAGHSAAYVDKISQNKGEKEMILPRGLNLYHEKTTNDGIYKVHHMKIVK